MAAPTERSPLTGSPPQSRRPLVKIAVAVVVAVAVALAVTLTLTRHGASSAPSPSALEATSSSAWSCGSPDFDAGYIKLANKKDDYFYYYFAPSTSSDPSRDPLVLWLTGGAGGSSLAALLTENGPCTVSDDGVSTTPNAYSWNQQANVIWLDQPTGVGFSYSTAIDEDADVDNFQVRIGENIYWFLQGFLDRHPEFDGRQFFITGESYAGHYIPSAAHFIVQANKQSPPVGKRVINLQGVAIGNGMVDPVTQFAHNIDMAESNSYNITLLSDAQIAQMHEDTPRCVDLTAQCQQTPTPLDSQVCADAMICLNEKLIVPYAFSHRNNYDIRKPCEQPTASNSMTVCGLDFAAVETLLAQPQVREALHVAPQADAWVPIRPSVAARFVRAGDFSMSYKELVTALLDDGSVRVLVYNGDADLMCNWRGGDAWTRALEWHGKEAFNAVEEHAFVATEGGDAVGTVRAFGNFTFLRVFNSGHMVPQDQPAVSLEMINRFFRNEPL